MTNGYFTTANLCQRYNCSSRTLYRWMSKPVNPLPAPRMKPSGSHNLWAIDDVVEWEQREAQKATKAA